MTKNYYRNDYSDKQWKALIDKATELGCQITYSKYGNIVTIDSPLGRTLHKRRQSDSAGGHNWQYC